MINKEKEEYKMEKKFSFSVAIRILKPIREMFLRQAPRLKSSLSSDCFHQQYLVHPLSTFHRYYSIFSICLLAHSTNPLLCSALPWEKFIGLIELAIRKRKYKYESEKESMCNNLLEVFWSVFYKFSQPWSLFDFSESWLVLKLTRYSPRLILKITSLWETPCWKKIDFIPAWSYTILQIKSNLDFISA